MKKGEATTTGVPWLRMSRDPVRRRRRARLKLPWLILLAVCGLLLPMEAWPPLVLFALFLSLAYLDESKG